MANNQITPFQLTDQFTMDNFNQRINETNTALQNKADAIAPVLHDIPLASGYEVPYGGFRYCKDQFGVVHINGVFRTTGGMTKGNNTIGTLPEGFRPTMQVYGAACMSLNWVTDSVAQFYIAIDGTIICSIGKDISSGNVVDFGVNVSFVSSI